MNQSIPTTPQDNPAETIMAALAHGMTGNTAAALPLLESFIASGPATTVGLCAALAESSAFHARKHLPAGGTFGLLVLDATNGTPGDINELPPGIRFAAQFSTAWGNGDKETAYALFHAVIGEGTEANAEALADGVRALFDMAVVSLNDLTGRTTA